MTCSKQWSRATVSIHMYIYFFLISDKNNWLKILLMGINFFFFKNQTSDVQVLKTEKVSSLK